MGLNLAPLHPPLHPPPPPSLLPSTSLYPPRGPEHKLYITVYRVSKQITDKLLKNLALIFPITCALTKQKDIGCEQWNGRRPLDSLRYTPIWVAVKEQFYSWTGTQNRDALKVNCKAWGGVKSKYMLFHFKRCHLSLFLSQLPPLPSPSIHPAL